MGKIRRGKAEGAGQNGKNQKGQGRRGRAEGEKQKGQGRGRKKKGQGRRGRADGAGQMGQGKGKKLEGAKQKGQGKPGRAERAGQKENGRRGWQKGTAKRAGQDGESRRARAQGGKAEGANLKDRWAPGAFGERLLLRAQPYDAVDLVKPEELGLPLRKPPSPKPLSAAHTPQIHPRHFTTSAAATHTRLTLQNTPAAHICQLFTCMPAVCTCQLFHPCQLSTHMPVSTHASCPHTRCAHVCLL
jgi:hypothetical protein